MSIISATRRGSLSGTVSARAELFSSSGSSAGAAAAPPANAGGRTKEARRGPAPRGGGGAPAGNRGETIEEGAAGQAAMGVAIEKLDDALAHRSLPDAEAGPY